MCIRLSFSGVGKMQRVQSNTAEKKLLFFFISIFLGCAFYFIVEKPLMIFLRRKLLKPRLKEKRVIQKFKRAYKMLFAH
jgi:hypothetical protein